MTPVTAPAAVHNGPDCVPAPPSSKPPPSATRMVLRRVGVPAHPHYESHLSSQLGLNCCRVEREGELASTRLGLALRDAYHKTTGIPFSSYAGHQAINPRNDLGGLNFSQVPKVFIECANMRNAGDAKILTSPDHRQAMAEGLAAGFAAFLAH